MKLTNADLTRFIDLTLAAAFDPDGKNEYKNLGRRILTYIAKGLGLQKGEYDIRWNPGGIACSGDHTLHTDNVYVALHDNCGLGWFYWRIVSGRMDYQGGQNRIVSWYDFRTIKDVDRLIKVLKVVQDKRYTDPQTGDIILNVDLALRMAAQA